ncbi:hypothetical protein Hsar01_03925 [Haloferula sargassicola]|uniref:Histidine kinase/HSP90-like ATPase domain-containing protein n=2 Tax=Haloferula sargassicola TaxID=490096 RepID=A0ABP9UX93_9BACT
MALAAGPAWSLPVMLGPFQRQLKASRTEPVNVTLRGMVRDLDREAGLLALEDESSVAILGLNLPDDAWDGLAPGEGVELDFHLCSFSLRGGVIECGMGPVVELDGRHPPMTAAGSVFLGRGPQPLRVEWFNGQATSALEFEIRAPGGHWVKPSIPDLRCELHEVPDIISVTEIPRRGGVAVEGLETIDATPAAGRDQVALRFTGELPVGNPGVYQVRLRCDDGAQVLLGRQLAGWRKIAPPAVEAGGKRKASTWETRRGTVTFAAWDGPGLRLELMVDSTREEARVLDAAGLEPEDLVGARLRVSGATYPGGICLLSGSTLSAEGSAKPSGGPLTRAFEVRELQPEQADRSHPVRLEGVVTMANSRSLVLQDESGGIFVLAGGDGNLSPTPVPGERWRIEGATSRGDFSPIVISENETLLGFGALPEPRRPTWEEILNGTLDAEQVEIEGVILHATDEGVDLLTYEGVVTIRAAHLYPLAEGLRDEKGRRSLIGARIRMRGVFGPFWDTLTDRLHPGVCFLGNATMSVVEAAPESIAAIPRIKIPDLWQFTTKSTALKRVRLRGRLMARRGSAMLVSDGEHVLRADSPEASAAGLGDLVEVVGFPRLSPVSPLLVQAVVRVQAAGALPPPREVAASALRDEALDGKMIAVEAKVVSDTLQQRERRLELEAGGLRFMAAGPASVPGTGPLPRDSRVRVAGVYFGGLGVGPDDNAGFELRLADAGGIEVLARPPWWNSRRLAILAGALLAGLGLVAAWAMVLHRLVARRTAELAVEIHEREQLESQRKLEEERARVARDLHDELGAGLTEIGMLGALLGRSEVPEENKDGYLGTLRQLAKDLVSGLDEIVWAINPSYDTVDDAASYLWLQAQRMLAPAGIECRLHQGGEVRGGQLGSRRRHALLLAFKEALNNVVRHSQATAIEVSIEIEGDFVVVSISDNGTGFDFPAGDSPEHHGLAGMRDRMRALGGDCRIRSVMAEGTTVRFEIPLKSR